MASRLYVRVRTSLKEILLFILISESNTKLTILLTIETPSGWYCRQCQVCRT
jgi:hypothetical protein